MFLRLDDIMRCTDIWNSYANTCCVTNANILTDFDIDFDITSYFKFGLFRIIVRIYFPL